MRTSASTPISSWTPSGGTKEATAVWTPALVLHAKVANAVPLAPQSFHERFTPAARERVGRASHSTSNAAQVLGGALNFQGTAFITHNGSSRRAEGALPST